MVSDRIYDLCRPVLDSDEYGEEEKTDKLEELLSSAPTSLKGKALEDAVLGALWQWKSLTEKPSSPPAVRGANVRPRSPATWLQRSITPVPGTSSPRYNKSTPAVPPGLGGAFTRTKSSTASPFTSPRASPKLPVATPVIPHSPRLSAYEFSDQSPTTENYGDYGSDIVDGLVNDDASSNTSFGDAAFTSEYMQPYTTEMSPYDMLRSILQDNRTDEELEQLLEFNGWDLSQTIASIMESSVSLQNMTGAVQADIPNRTYLVGKSMSPASRPLTPAGQQKSPIVCRYWLSSGHCARADCRFAHEVQNHVCKYWLQGNCIAGPSCLFSHDPSHLMQNLSLVNSGSNTPQQFTPNFQLSDYDSFPALQPTTSNPYEETSNMDPASLVAALQQQQQALGQQMPGLFPTFVPIGPRYGSRPNSRPSSRHTSRAPTPAQVNFNDDEAFPSLGSAAAARPGKRHHGKRGGHGHPNNNIPAQPSNLADVVRMSPSPGPNAREAMRRGLRNNRSFTSTRENSATAMAIPAPTDIPWLKTGEANNKAYLEAREEAFRHGSHRNKFLQSAAQAWNRNDSRGAKALSLKGQNENTLMREKHREAARVLYEERNRNASLGKELYVDLHGLHPEEAVQYLADCLKEQKLSERPVYAICGTGHHSKNGKDKVGKAVRVYLTEWRYAFREFSVPGDRNNVGGVLGIDPKSYDKEMARKGLGPAGGDGDSGVDLLGEGRKEDSKVTVVREDPRRVAQMAEGEGDEVPTNLTTWQWAFENPNSPPRTGAYINASTRERLPFADVEEQATQLSTVLVREHGLQPGDTVSLFATNTIWYPVAMWAAARAGARVNGASPAYGEEEMVHALKTAGTKFLFTLPEALEVVLKVAEQVGLSEDRIFLLEGQGQGVTTLQDLVMTGRWCEPVDCWTITEGKTNKEVCGFLNFSSGTTGLPKAVMLSHHNIMAQCLQLRQLQVVPPGERYRILAVMPLFHITGLVRFCNYPVLMDGECIMLPSFTMEGMLRAIVEWRIPELILVPPILIRMMRDPVVDKFLPDLRRIVKRWSSGSAPTSPEIIELLRRKFPATGFRQGYGATESTACISCHPPTHYDYKYATTGGLLCANTTAKVIDLDDPGKMLGPNQVGEILAKGPQIAMGYLDNPKATAETFDKEGFLHTGDVGYLDDEGLFHIEDRIKEMIKVKGQQVAPAELEDTLLGHPAVEECAVLGIPDEYAGERPKAFVVVNGESSEALGRELLAWVKEKKVRYKWVSEVEFTDVVPKSATGKLLRRVLKGREREKSRVRGVVVKDGGERARL